MKKILLHTNGNRQYRAIVRQLSSLQNDALSVQVSNLHNNIFDTTYVYKPDILLFPFVEYTQEVHSYIENNHAKHKIVLYIDMTIDNDSLVKYIGQTKCLSIVKNNSTIINSNSLIFDYLYDNSIYYQLPNRIRNNKIAVSLSNDNEKNKKILSSYIYPNQYKNSIVLFNNPEFQHPQNIGIYNEQDLNIVLNTYEYFIDIDCEFQLESAATDIKWIDSISDPFKKIDNNDISNEFSGKYTEYQITNFIKEKLIPYLGI